MEEVGSRLMAWKQRVTRPRTLAMIAGCAALGVGAAVAWWRFFDVPRKTILQMRMQSTSDVATLYRLQMFYKKKKGTYAKDLISLLSVAPDGAALVGRLKADVDMNTLVVTGNAKKFRIELNVLDADRTLIKIKGPIVLSTSTAAALPTEPSVVVSPDGAPIPPPAAGR